MLQAMLQGMLQASRQRTDTLQHWLDTELEIARLEEEGRQLREQRDALLDGMWGKGAPPCETLPQIEPEATAPSQAERPSRLMANLGTFGGKGSPYTRDGATISNGVSFGRHSPLPMMARDAAPRVTIGFDMGAAEGDVHVEASVSPDGGFHFVSKATLAGMEGEGTPAPTELSRDIAEIDRRTLGAGWNNLLKAIK